MKTSILTCLLALVVTSPAMAQMFRTGPIERFGLEPFLARYYADKLDLTREQRAFVDEQIRETKQRYASLNAELQRETARMSVLIEKPGVAEQEVLGQLDRVLDLERQIKRVNVTCSFRVRQRLTAAQVALLRNVEVPPPPPPPPPPGPAPRPPQAPKP